LSLEALRRFDARGTAGLRGLLPHTPPVRAGLSLAAHSADSLVLVPLLGLLWWRQGFARSGSAVPLAAAFLLSVVLTTIAKYLVRRSRPKGEWGALYRKTDPHSFPSGHASRTAALTVVALARGLAAGGQAGAQLGTQAVQPALLPGLLPALLLGLWALLVGFARVALGVHYLLDVLAGYLLGLVIGTGVALWLLQGLPW